jgi:Cellulase (glycosyl hydrolase family 5)
MITGKASMTIKKRTVFALIIIGLAIIGSAGWQLLSHAPDLSATTIASNHTQSERFGPEDTSLWPQSNLDWQTSPVDLSFLNATEKPAGRRGFVKAAGESLVFEDGSPARFWGTNLAAYALFDTSRDNVKQQAKRISALGFNLVRIHHHDSPWVNPNIFGKGAADTQTLDPASLDKLDWWIKCLKDEGIYLWLDLHVQRALTEGDHIYGFDEIRKSGKTADLKGYNYVNLTIQQAMKRFNEAYLNHSNTYTGVAYKNEPAIMALLITNENDITYHFGNALLPNQKVPLHNQLYMNLAKDFATQNGLPTYKTWRSWEPGPSKLFLNNLEHRFDIDMISHLHGLGAHVPIATTSTWGGGALFSLPALTTGDIIDAHAYGEALELDKNPLTGGNMVNRLSMGQVAGKPMSVTEWNVSPFPAPDRHSSPLYIASAARLQGWDAIMLFAYAQAPLNDAGTPSNWNAFNDPALVATLPAAALLYRQGHVKEADTTYALAPDREQLFYQSNSPDNSIAARTASEKGKLVIVMPKIPELPWLKNGPIPLGAKVIQNLNQSMIADNATEVVSDTGEIRRNWAKGIYTINTPRSQAAMGWIGNEPIILTDVKLDIRTRNASVAVQSLDGAPIKLSSSLMISLGAQAIPTGNTLPFRSEPVLGQLTIHARKGLKLFKTPPYQKEKEIPVDYSDGKYVINLETSLGTSWLFLK